MSRRYLRETMAPLTITILLLAIVLFSVCNSSISAMPVTESTHENRNERVSPPDPGTRWFVGGHYAWDPQNARTMSTTIQIPNSEPSSSQYYYVLLSAIDDAGSYNQIGFCAINNVVWTLLYSWTSGPLSNPASYNPKYGPTLTRGATYTFKMTTQSGVTQFFAYQGSTCAWSTSVTTGGNNLIANSQYYTVFEEMVDVTDGAPTCNFYFYDNYFVKSSDGSIYYVSWETLKVSSPGVDIPSKVKPVLSPDKNAVLCSNGKSDFVIGVSPRSGSSSTYQSTTATVSIASIEAFQGSVSLSISYGGAFATTLYYYRLDNSYTGRTYYVWSSTYLGSYYSPYSGIYYYYTSKVTISPTNPTLYSYNLENNPLKVTFSIDKCNTGTRNSVTITIACTGGGLTRACTYVLTMT